VYEYNTLLYTSTGIQSIYTSPGRWGAVHTTLPYTTLPGKKIGNTSRLLVYTSPAPLTLVRVRTGTYAYQKIRRRVSAIVRQCDRAKFRIRIDLPLYDTKDAQGHHDSPHSSS
jgi:hypothetical protein